MAEPCLAHLTLTYLPAHFLGACWGGVRHLAQPSRMDNPQAVGNGYTICGLPDGPTPGGGTFSPYLGLLLVGKGAVATIAHQSSRTRSRLT